MFEIVGYSEIETNAVNVYKALANATNCHNYGDIRNVTKDSVNTEIDLLVGGSPCTDFSSAGLGAGCMYICTHCNHSFNPLTISRRNRNNCPRCGKRIEEKTRSSLLMEYLRVVKETKPKLFIWENVKSVATHKKYKSTYNLFISELKSYGYNVYTHFTNALDYGIPQNRERVFLIGIYRFYDTTVVNLSNRGYRNINIADILQPASEIQDNLWLSDIGATDIEIIQRIKNECTKSKVQRVYDKTGYLPLVFGLRNTADLHRIPCITTNSNSPSGDGAVIIKQNNRIRKISVKECFSAMGFSNDDYDKINALNLSDRIARQLAGNSIVIDVLVSLYHDLYQSQPHLFNDNMRVLSVCSGIGAFESALQQFYSTYYKYNNVPISANRYTVDNCLLQYDDLIPTIEVCNILQIHRHTLQALVESNKLDREVHKNKYYITKSSLLAYLNKAY